MDEIVFVECEDCAKKTGTPKLCPQCLSVRGIVETANTVIVQNNKFRSDIDRITDDLEVSKQEVKSIRQSLVKVITNQMKRCKKCLKRSIK